jgi:hypothetical protein
MRLAKEGYAYAQFLMGEHKKAAKQNEPVSLFHVGRHEEAADLGCLAAINVMLENQMHPKFWKYYTYHRIHTGTFFKVPMMDHGKYTIGKYLLKHKKLITIGNADNFFISFYEYQKRACRKLVREWLLCSKRILIAFKNDLMIHLPFEISYKIAKYVWMSRKEALAK